MDAGVVFLDVRSSLPPPPFPQRSRSREFEGRLTGVACGGRGSGRGGVDGGRRRRERCARRCWAVGENVTGAAESKWKSRLLSCDILG